MRTKGSASDGASSPIDRSGRATLRQREELAQQYGERHPAMISVGAKLSLCRETFGPDAAPPPEPEPPPDAARCASLRATREALVAKGLGPRHPERMVVEARLEACADE